MTAAWGTLHGGALRLPPCTPSLAFGVTLTWSNSGHWGMYGEVVPGSGWCKEHGGSARGAMTSQLVTLFWVPSEPA